MIKGINHVGISVMNLERSVRFYLDQLGMQVVIEAREFSGERYERILALEGARGKVALLQRGTLQLELFEFIDPPPREKDPNYSVADRGISHFCIEVEDLDTLYDRLHKAGVRFHCPPVEFVGEAKATYGRDPDGNVFELLELTPGEPA